METVKIEPGTRWSGFDWATEKQNIMLIGAGGIGSWLALSLARIGHSLYLVDDDRVDRTNINGGQMFRMTDLDGYKVHAVAGICRDFGCLSSIVGLEEKFLGIESGNLPIMIGAVDNMLTRRSIFDAWRVSSERLLLLDGRLTGEMYEVFAIQGDKPEQLEEYERKHLFSDEETVELDCTTKQTTFAAMGIASVITATLCNFLTNKKMGMEFREVPFYQREFLPIFSQTKREVEYATAETA